MEYEQIPEASDLSCEGCFFNRELFAPVYVKSGRTLIQKGSVSKHKWACFSPSTEPFSSCKERHVIFRAPET